jgi:preprotein translocase subunit SecF
MAADASRSSPSENKRMEFFKTTPQIDFMRWRRLFLWISGGLIVLSVILFFVRGFNLGIDFTGGTLVEVYYPQPVQLAEVREDLEQAGLGDSVTQYFGTAHEVLIRIPPQPGRNTAELSNRVLDALQNPTNQAELRRVEFVGPQVGEDLREQGGLAVLYALIGILIYVTLRFEWRMALGAVIAIIHDVILTLGFFSLTGLQFDLNVLAAILTIIGYSINDSIVVFDRIRENFRKIRRRPADEIMNTAINETLSRTIMTGVSTMLVLTAMYFIGGEVLASFSLALIVGIVIGTYSSVYVASAYALMLGINRMDLMPVKKEGETFSERP